MSREKKSKCLDEIKTKLKKYKTFVITDYKGLTVKSITDIRKKLYKNEVIYQILKNKLFKIALNDVKINGLDKYLKGPSAIAFSKEDSIFPSKVLVKESLKGILNIKIAYSNGQILDKKSVIELSKISSKEELLLKILYGLKSPLNNIVNLLKEPLRRLVFVLKNVEKNKFS